MHLAVRTLGTGPRIVLVHGGLGPELSWERQEPLAERHELVVPWRRGYGDSPAVEGQDFEVDADDVAALLGEGAHLVGFSYGALGASIAAGRAPERVRALVLIEPPLFGLAPDDPAVRETMAHAARIFSAEGPAARGAFKAFAGIDRELADDELPLLDEPLRAARGSRPPFEAQPDLEAIRALAVPVLVVSGSDRPGFSRVCDLIAERTGGERLTIEGAGHAVQRSAGFNEHLERFLAGAGGSRVPAR